MKVKEGKQRREYTSIFISVEQTPCEPFFHNSGFRCAETAGAWVSRLSYGSRLLASVTGGERISVLSDSSTCPGDW